MRICFMIITQFIKPIGKKGLIAGNTGSKVKYYYLAMYNT